MDHDARVAASELVNLMVLLAEADTPHSKNLALIVALRLKAVARQGAGEVLSDEELAQWIELGTQLENAG